MTSTLVLRCSRRLRAGTSKRWGFFSTSVTFHGRHGSSTLLPGGQSPARFAAVRRLPVLPPSRTPRLAGEVTMPPASNLVVRGLGRAFLCLSVGVEDGRAESLGFMRGARRAAPG